MTRDLALPERGRPTPGPWRIYGPHPDTLGGRHLTILAGTGKARFGVADIRIIDPNDAMEASANANLIAAAPDLYEALDYLVNAGLTLTDEGRAKADAALAKARGEQSL